MRKKRKGVGSKGVGMERKGQKRESERGGKSAAANYLKALMASKNGLYYYQFSPDSGSEIILKIG